MTDTFFPTSTPAMAEETKQEIIDRQTAEIASLKSNLDQMTSNWNYAKAASAEYRQKIANVKGYIFDLYSANGDIDDEIKEIADLLDITLLKEIQGTAMCEISWTAQVPLDFDADDFEISFDVNCETYEAEAFEYNEDNLEVSGEDA